jgi:hypothetical protein
MADRGAGAAARDAVVSFLNRKVGGSSPLATVKISSSVHTMLSASAPFIETRNLLV